MAIFKGMTILFLKKLFLSSSAVSTGDSVITYHVKFLPVVSVTEFQQKRISLKLLFVVDSYIVDTVHVKTIKNMKK